MHIMSTFIMTSLILIAPLSFAHAEGKRESKENIEKTSDIEHAKSDIACTPWDPQCK